MNSTDKKRQFILEFLLPYNHDVSLDVIEHLIKAGKIMGYSADELFKELVTMDNQHDQLLKITYLAMPDDHYLADTGQSTWISGKGERFLYIMRGQLPRN
ncbi:hypothetical protein [Lentilactobacillus kosonis]|uniref:Uncharacterized protein n=1 Tax=Lentilactobacillus kosonis TaxID=2810561 RepID=A0A401FL15_9LACO|nr:hypothetical protein [Lentilactobacillus kosonis]GAY72901.1 hypothetical protein NBRC111893_1047 [Lentilactobacillus kosonis]